MTNEEIDQHVLKAVNSIGGGTVLKAIWYDVPNDITYKQTAASLRRLQRRGLVFNHDPGGSLGVWGGIGKKARYWSTREQLKRIYGYSDEDIGVSVTNPWEHVGGGCLVGPRAEGMQYPCDDDFEDAETGEMVNVQTSLCGHINLPTRYGGKVGSMKEIMCQPGVKKGSKRTITPPKKKRKNPSMREIMRKAMK